MTDGVTIATRDLPAGSVAFGNPATVRGRVKDLADISTRVRDGRRP